MTALSLVFGLSLGLVALPNGPMALTRSSRATWASSPSIVAHGGSHARKPREPREPLPLPVEGGGPLSRLSQAIQYTRIQVVRPLVVHCLITYSYISRHALDRSMRKRVEFTDNASRITWIGAVVNLALALLKLFAGIVGQSAAMISDAGHSFSDLLSDGVTLLAVRMSALPADVDHPYGHGRFESVGSLAIGTLLVGAGFSFGVSAVGALRSPSLGSPGRVALWAAAASIVSKEVLFRATAAVGRRLRSSVLLANAWHHRSDALSSVVALVGIGGSLCGWHALDPLAGICVAALVSWMGLRISIEALAQLTDTSDYAVVQAVEDVTRNLVGVRGVDQIRSRSMGGSAFVDLAIQVDPRLSASSAHRLAEEVRLTILQEAPELTEINISEVLVHVDTSPHDASCPLQSSAALSYSRAHHVVEEDVARQLVSLPEVTGVPRVEVFYLEDGLSVQAHARMLDHLTVAQLRGVARRGRELLLDSAADLTDASVLVDLSEGAQDAEGTPLAASVDSGDSATDSFVGASAPQPE